MTQAGGGHDVDWFPAPSSPRTGSLPLQNPAPELEGATISSAGWANPTAGRLTSDFGPRVHPVLGIAGLHTGQDIANACGTPVYAAASGRVVWAGGALQGRTGNQLVIAHGNGVVTRYGHLLTGSLEVSQGEAVKAGQRIAGMGGDRELDPLGAGNSTGCHLHLEVNLNNGLLPVDPLAWFAERGIALGSDEPGVVRGAENDGGALEVVLAASLDGEQQEDEREQRSFDELAAELDAAFEAHRMPVIRQLG